MKVKMLIKDVDYRERFALDCSPEESLADIRIKLAAKFNCHRRQIKLKFLSVDNHSNKVLLKDFPILNNLAVVEVSITGAILTNGFREVDVNDGWLNFAVGQREEKGRREDFYKTKIDKLEALALVGDKMAFGELCDLECGASEMAQLATKVLDKLLNTTKVRGCRAVGLLAIDIKSDKSVVEAKRARDEELRTQVRTHLKMPEQVSTTANVSQSENTVIAASVIVGLLLIATGLGSALTLA